MSTQTSKLNVFYWLRYLYDLGLKWADHKHKHKVMALVAFTESSFFLIPPDALIIGMGVSNPKSSYWNALNATFFSVLGGLFGYWIGMTAWDVVSPYFFQFVFSEAKFNTAIKGFQENGFLALFIGSFTPIPFKAFTVAGGVANLNLLPFVTGALVGRASRYFLLASLFYFFGAPIRTFVDKYFEKITIAITLAIFIGLWLFSRLKET
jgi:membrane protein YqaA with SNARE-associated domain